MPQEPLPWDRKEGVFKDRKYERTEPLGSLARWAESSSSSSSYGGPRDFYRWGSNDFRRLPGDRKEFFFRERRYERFDPIGPVPRWRDSYHQSGYPRDFQRWGGAPDFRRPLGGHGKQGGWHMFPEEAGHGYAPSRSSERNLEGDCFRAYPLRTDGRYSSRNSRDYRVPFNQRDWKGGHSWDSSNGTPASGRVHDVGSERRSVDNSQRDWKGGHCRETSNGSPASGGLHDVGSNRRSVDSSQRDWKGGQAWESGNVSPTFGNLHDVGTERRSVDNSKKDGKGGHASEPCNRSPACGGLHEMGSDRRSVDNSQNELKSSHSWETSNGSLTSERLRGVGSDQSSADNTLKCSSLPDCDLVKTGEANPLDPENQADKLVNVNGLNKSQKFDTGNRENSLGTIDWKPLKWTRSGSLSRGSAFSHSSCSKGIGGNDSNEIRADSQPKSATPLNSPSADAAACVTSAVPVDEATSTKKPRLRWGEGLAKYEKKKVEEPDESANRNEHVISKSNLDHVQSTVSDFADKSPGIAGFPDCTSPATPSSVACSSSSGSEQNSLVKSSNGNYPVSSPCASPGTRSQNLEGFSFKLEKLDSLVSNLDSSLMELLQSDETDSVNPDFVRSTAMNKLLVWKGEFLKELENTESRVDALENELKSVISDDAADKYFALPVAVDAKSYREHSASDAIPRPTSPLPIASGDVIVDKMPLHTDGKDGDVDSPGTATSKYIQPVYVEGAVSPSDTAKSADCSAGSSVVAPGNIEGRVIVSSDGGAGISSFERGMPVRTGNDGLISYNGSKEDELCNLILALNKESADKASEELFKRSPGDLSKSYMSGLTDLSWLQNGSAIKEKFVMKKRFQRFKERVITMKFQALQHLWKEDLGLLSIQKCRAKSQRRLDLFLRQSGCQKRRSSMRTRVTSTAGNSSLVPTSEAIDFTRKLLLDSQPKLHRLSLNMPAQILDKKERVSSRFINGNGLIEDPCAVERERPLINPWTTEEKEIFMDKFAIFGKDFRKIASFIEHKTTADCIEFYYKNHKSECFVKAKKQDAIKQVKSSTNTYMLTSGKRWNCEMNAASLDMLGKVSVIAARADDNALKQRFCARLFSCGHSKSKTADGDDGFLGRSSRYGDFGNERETVAADVLAGMCGSISPEAMSSCLTSSVGPSEGNRAGGSQKMDTAIRKHLTSEVTLDVTDENCSDESCEEMESEFWTDGEKSIFVQAFASYGKDFSTISRCVRTKSRNQCKVFFSKVRKCLGLDSLHAGPGVVKPSVSDDEDGGGSDMEDACVAETGLVLHCDDVVPKSDGKVVTSSENVSHFVSGPPKKIKVETDLNLSEEIKSNGIGIEQTGWRDAKAVETLFDACQSGEWPRPVTCGRINVVNSDVCEKPKVPCSETADHGISSSDSVNEETLVTEMGREGVENDLEKSESTVLENHLSESRDEISNADTSSECFLRGPGNDPGSTGDCSEINLQLENYHSEAMLESNNVEEPHQVAVQKGIAVQDRLSSTLNLHQETKGEQHDVCGNKSRRDPPKHAFLNPCESSKILQGYPLHISSEGKLYGDINGEVSGARSLSKSDSFSDCYLRKCNNSNSLTSEHTFQKGLEKSYQQSAPPSKNTSNSEKPSRNGDVILFGQILGQSSSDKKPISTALQSEKKRINQSKPIKQSNLNFIGNTSADPSSTLLNFCQSNQMGPESLPVRSYGYWDGSRLPASLPHPDSAILLAKYPSALGNYLTPLSELNQQSLSSSGHSLNGAFPTRILRGNGAADFQLNRGQDLMQYQDMYSEMQRYRASEAMSALQHHGSGVVGTNILTEAGLVTGACPAVQDPVTAFCMQYAKSDQFGREAGNITGEEPPWIGKGL